MAKQSRDDSQKKKTTATHQDPKSAPQDQAAETGDAAKKTKLAQKTGQPTKLAQKTSQPTQLAKKGPQPTMLAADAPKSPDTPPKMPKMSLEEEAEVVEAEPAPSDVVEVQPVSDVVEAAAVDSGAVEAVPAEADDIFTADSARTDKDAAAQSAPETPVRAEQAREESGVSLTSEDAVGEQPAAAHAESSVRVTGKKKPRPDLESTEAFDLSATPAADATDQTVNFDHVEGGLDDSSSAVDLGGRPYPKKGSSHAGVDEVAEELESGVKLEAADARKTEPNVDFDDLAMDASASASEVRPVKRRQEKEERTDPDLKVPPAMGSELAEEVAADALLDDDETSAKSAEHVSADTLEGAEKDEVAEAGPSTPLPARRKAAAEADEEELEEAEEEIADEEAAPPRRKPGGATAVATRPVKPKYGRRWLGGILVGLLVGVGAVVGLRYFDPEILEQGFGSLPGAPTPAPKSDPKAAAEVSQLRSQLQKATSDKEELQKQQEEKAAEYKKLEDALQTAKQNDKVVAQMKDALAKAMVDKEQNEALVQSIHKALVNAKQIGEEDKLDAATVAKVVKDLNDKQAGLAEVNKLLQEAKVKDPGSKGVGELLAARKDLDEKLAAINKLLEDEKIKGEGAAGLKEVVSLRNQVQKDRDELDQALKTAYKELANAQLVPPGGDPRKGIVAGTKAALQRGESPLAIPLAQLANALASLSASPAAGLKGSFETAALLAEVGYYRLREPLIAGPEQMLDAYLAIHQDRKRSDPQLQAAALRDAAWVLSPEAKASPVAKAKAHAVIGLIRRNQEKYAEAKQALEAALAGADKGAAPWSAVAKAALEEMTNPAAFYLPRIDQLQTGGDFKSAYQELNSALKVMPGDGRLLAQRGLLKLEELRGSGKISPKAAAEIRADATQALKNPKTSADGAYVLGQLEEELGNFDKAEQLYRQALKASKGSAEDTARLRIALARVLQRDRVPVAAPPAIDEKENEQKEKKQEKKEPKKAPEPKADLSQAFPLAAMLVVAQAAADDMEDASSSARLKESMDLARELIESSNPKIKGEGYLLLGQALARQGKRTEGLREYMKGMELMYPGMASKEMAKLIEEHPAFQQADASRAPSAYLAEVHFGKGLHLYWSRQYPKAEAEFKQAAGFYPQDARYQYFLGLAQYAQQSKVKRDAANYSFEQGAKLEAENRPPVSEINASLERIQGDLRKMINEFRAKAIELRN